MMRFTSFALFSACALCFVATGPAAARDPVEQVAILRGGCTLLRVVKYDWTRGCQATLTNEVYASGRVAFTYVVSKGSTVTFSGAAPQVKQGADVAIQPIDRVVWKFDTGVPPHVFPAVGKCRFSNPYRGKAVFACEASGSDGAYQATFITDGAPPTVREY